LPHLPSITRVPQLAQLASELAHARVAVLLDDARRCEQLGLELVASERYEAQWLVACITGYGQGKLKLMRNELQASDGKQSRASKRAVAASQPPAADALSEQGILGSDVLHDLGALCELLCQRAIDASHDDADARAAIQVFASEAMVPMASLRKELGVSIATMSRLRRSGMVTRRVPGARGLPMVGVCAAHAARVREHAAKHKTTHMIDRRSKPIDKRMSTREMRLYVRAALRYRTWARLSLHAAAQRLAAWSQRRGTPRSVEGLRGLLQRDPRTKQAFPPKAKRGQRRALAMLVLLRKGKEPSELAKLSQRTPPLVRRDVALARRALLQAWLVQAEIISGPAFHASKAKEALLANVQTVTMHAALAAAPLQTLRAELPLPAQREKELAIAMHFLRWQAAGVIPGLSPLHPSQHKLDSTETKLRGAWLLRCALAASQRRRVLETLEARCSEAGLGATWEEVCKRVSVSRVRALLVLAVRALHEGVEGFDPFKGGRLAASCSLRIDRALARALREQGAKTQSDVQSKLVQGKAARAQPLAGVADAIASTAGVLPHQLALLAALRMPSDPSRADGPLALVLPPARVLRVSSGGPLDASLRDVLVRRLLAPIAPGAYALPCTLRELGEQLGLDDIRVFALQQRALRAINYVSSQDG
jgi:hypothetical protein